LLRANETAHIIRAGHEERPEVKPDPGLYPWDVHAFENQKESEVKDDIEHYRFETPGLAIPGGESYEQHLSRLLPFVADRFKEALQRRRGAVVLVHHSRNFPDVHAWHQSGMNGTDVDEDVLRKGVQVQPGEIAEYTHNGKDWVYKAIPVAKEKGHL